MLKEKNGETIACTRSGLTSTLRDCGVRSDWYAYVFVGSISAITNAGDEKQLQLIPEEVFYGRPGNSLVVRTDHGDCLPDMAIGDRWLFFLRREKGKPIVLDYGGNDSKPVAEVEDEIETLRRLQTIGDNAILRGEVIRGASFSGAKPMAGTHLIARRVSDDALFTAGTDVNGRYEFQVLPPGRYKLTVDPVGSFRADDSHIDLKPGACWDLTLSRAPHAEIAGHVRRSDDSPVPNVPVQLVTEDGQSFNSITADQRGYFRFDSLRPGKYIVGVNLPGSAPWKIAGGDGPGLEIPSASLYYPGVPNRSEAIFINIRTDEKRTDIDFTVPTH